MSAYSEQILARRKQPWRPLPALPPRGEDVIAQITCPNGGKYYLRTCERDCGATVCHRCGQSARSIALFNADLLEKFNWTTPIKEMGAAQLIEFTAAFNVECKKDCATTSLKVLKKAA